jgi:hypothetical protein
MKGKELYSCEIISISNSKIGVKYPTHFSIPHLNCKSFLASILNNYKESKKFVISLYHFFLCFSILIILSPYLQSQESDLPFENFSVDEGMPTATNCILQDKTGFLWFATGTGLLTFDKKSKKFNQVDLEGNCVFSERSGTVWVGADTQIKKINRVELPFKKYPYEGIICDIVNGNEGMLWMFILDEWWKKFDVRKGQFVPYSFGNDFLYFVYPEGDLAFIMNDGSFYIRDSSGTITCFLDSSLKDFNKSLSWGWKTDKGYWLGTHQGGFCLLDPKTNQVSEIRNLKLNIYYIYEDSFGLLWISTFMGKVFCYNPDRDSLAEFIPDSKELSTISGRVISQIYEDKKGRLWFATNNGLNKLDR